MGGGGWGWIKAGSISEAITYKHTSSLRFKFTVIFMSLSFIFVVALINCFLCMCVVFFHDARSKKCTSNVCLYTCSCSLYNCVCLIGIIYVQSLLNL